MKRIAICLLLLLALPLHAQEYDYVAGAGGAAAACSSGSADVTQTTYTTVSTLGSGVIRGQSWKPATNGAYLYSISIIPENNAGTVTVTCRWGSNANLATYLGEVTKTDVSVSAGTAIEFVFSDTSNQLSTATTYYTLCKQTAGTGVQWREQVGSSVYADGQAYTTTAADWDLTGHQDANDDFTFIIKKCD